MITNLRMELFEAIVSTLQSTTHLKEAHSSLVSPELAVGLEVPQSEVGEVESFSPSLNITFILKGTTANREHGT